MERLSQETEKILLERFGKDSIIALATTDDDVPYVRNVDAFYEDRAFYVLTYRLSGKMQQIEKNPVVAVSGEWFTAHGWAYDMGCFASDENKRIAQKMRELFSAWIDNGHNDLEDENTCILCIRLTSGVLFSDGARYEIDFSRENENDS